MTVPESGTRRSFCGLANAEGPTEEVALQFNFDVELTVEEYEALKLALESVIRIGTRQMFDLIQMNYEKLESLNSYYRRLFGTVRDQGRIPPHRAAIGMMSAVIDWLNVVRLFLDHEETWLKRKFGACTWHLREFKEACSKAFDNSVAYRFLYQLRNYATHCGVPVSSVNLFLATQEEQASVLHQRISFSLNRDELLWNFDWGRHVRPDLEAMAEKFEVLPLVSTPAVDRDLCG